MALPMKSKMVRAWEAPVTVWALERFDSGMLPEMPSEFIRASKLPRATFPSAFVGLFTWGQNTEVGGQEWRLDILKQQQVRQSFLRHLAHHFRTSVLFSLLPIKVKEVDVQTILLKYLIFVSHCYLQSLLAVCKFIFNPLVLCTKSEILMILPIFSICFTYTAAIWEPHRYPKKAIPCICGLHPL